MPIDYCALRVLMRPQTNIVCFRHIRLGLSAKALNQHQGITRQKLVQSGSFHLTQVKLDNQLWLRTTIMNPLTAESDLDALLEAIRRNART